MANELDKIWCPFAPAINQFAIIADRNTLEWAQRFNLLARDDRYGHARPIEYGWLAARAYPNSGWAELQIAADWISWLFLMDDECDETGVGRDPRLLGQLHDRMIAILRGAEPADSDEPLARALHDLRSRMAERASPAWLERFTSAVEDYFAANRWEANNRLLGITPSLGTYQIKRAHTGAVFACFELLSITDGIDLPPAVRDSAVVQGLTLLANCVICWCNDILSVNKEHKHGDVHNLVIVLQHERQLSNEAAMRETVQVHNDTVQAFLDLEKKLPSFGPEVDAEVARYVDSLRHWMRANLDWSWTALRYERLVEARPGEHPFALPQVL
ncbi:MAG: hypothetical protein U1A78_12045 [Polyangia bacterium]